MSVYEFQCPRCNSMKEVTCTYDELPTIVKCEVTIEPETGRLCGGHCKRVYSVPNICHEENINLGQYRKREAEKFLKREGFKEDRHGNLKQD